jgi:membrane protease YdiL (CAAX protease family)
VIENGDGLNQQGKFFFKTSLYKIFSLFLSLAAIAMIATVLCMFVGGLWLGLTTLWSHSRAFGSISGLTAAFIVYLGVGIATLSVARLQAGAAWREMIASRPWSLARRQPAFWLIVGGALAYSVAADFAFSYFDLKTEARLTMPKDFGQAAAIFVLATVFAPFVEEVLFRGIIFTRLRRDFNFTTALLLSSITFAGLLYEETHLYALAVFPIGLALGAMREVSGSIKSCIAFHAFNNFIACMSGLLDF